MAYSKTKRSGMTLIEVIIYVVLLSFLLAGFIDYSFSVHMRDIDLIHQIDDAYSS